MADNWPVMKRFRPAYGFLLMAVLIGGWVAVQSVGGSQYQRVTPDPDGLIRIDVGDLAPLEARFYRYLNSGNQEVAFFVARDPGGGVQVAFDANEVCYKKKRGYRAEGEWVVCNFCDKAFRVAGLNEGGGGCKPVPLVHRIEGQKVVLTEPELLRGWRYFR
jgi:uncharacterized membrane protein